MAKFLFVLVFVDIYLTCANGQTGKKCITPNKESGDCIKIFDCQPIIDEIKTKTRAAFQFAKESGCGFVQKTPLVCCGSTGKYEIIDISTRNPIFTNYYTRPTESSTTTIKRFPTTSSTVLIPTTSSSSTLLADRHVCGRQIYEDRIVGGDLTALGEFPWLVLLRYKLHNGKDAGFKCGGTIINQRYILTAAHCVSGSFEEEFTLSSVRLGEWNISSPLDCKNHNLKNDCADPVVDLYIERIIKHPYHEGRTGNNDIALLKLERNFEYTNFIRPICLSTDDTSETNVYYVSGWGQTDYFADNSEVKLKVKLPLVPSEVCRVQLGRRNWTVTNNMLCAGGEEGKDSCKGDSGGPLMTVTRNLQWFQRGIVSKGVACGLPDTPAIYTRISRYYKWILNNIKKYGF